MQLHGRAPSQNNTMGAVFNELHDYCERTPYDIRGARCHEAQEHMRDFMGVGPAGSRSGGSTMNDQPNDSPPCVHDREPASDREQPASSEAPPHTFEESPKLPPLGDTPYSKEYAGYGWHDHDFFRHEKRHEGPKTSFEEQGTHAQTPSTRVGKCDVSGSVAIGSVLGTAAAGTVSCTTGSMTITVTAALSTSGTPGIFVAIGFANPMIPLAIAGVAAGGALVGLIYEVTTRRSAEKEE